MDSTAPIALEAQIEHVTVYRSSALVKRRATHLFDNKSKTLEIRGLPIWLDDQSVRVKTVDAEATAFVQEVQVQWDLDLKAHDDAPTLQQELQRCEERKRLLELELNFLQQERNELNNLRPTPPTPDLEGEQGMTLIPAPIEGSLALLDFLQERFQEIDKTLTRLQEELRQSNEEWNRLQKEWNASQENTQEDFRRPTKKLQIQLHSSSPSDASTDANQVEFEISYQMPGALWFPMYEVRFTEDGTQAEFVVQAQLAQVTGELWPDARITLSTAELNRFCDLPKLQSLRLGRQEADPVQTGWRPAPQGTDLLFEGYDQAWRLQSKTSPTPITTAASSTAGFNEGDFQESSHYDAGESERFDELEFEQNRRMYKDDDIPTLVGADADLLYDEKAPSEELIDGLMMLEPPQTRGGLSFSGAIGGAAMAATESIANFGGGGHRPDSKMHRERKKKRKVPREARAPMHSKLAPSPKKPEPVFAKKVAQDKSQQEFTLLQRQTTEWLQFGQLRLGGLDSQDRGRLYSLPPQAQIQEAGGAQLQWYVAQKSMQEFAIAWKEVQSQLLPQWASRVSSGLGHFDHVYEAHGRFQIPSDGQYHQITLMRMSLPVSLIYRTIPMLEAKVYREARITNELKVPLLTGPAQVFWDGDYLLTSHVPNVPQGGKLQLGLGEEEKLQVARNTHHKEEVGGLLSHHQVLSHEVEIEIQSHLSQSAQIEVIERVPLSGEKKVIKVEVDKLSPRAEEYDQQDRQAPIKGGKLWRLNIPAGEKRTCELRYHVQLPAKQQLLQGNRRL